ncbi:hypothetical protein LZ30DRAFT_424016 [Colletotrichum cereale]|nr:hypothetical protein LZ30DRAFT_424016 [Colletotrichum cereale]
MEARGRHVALTAKKVEGRLANPSANDGRGCMSYILDSEAERLTDREVNEMASSFIFAGSRTSAIGILGISYFLGWDRARGCRASTPSSRRRYVFVRPAEHDSAVGAVAGGHRDRRPAAGCPAARRSALQPYSTDRTEDNFQDAAAFVPEHWLESRKGGGESAKDASDDKSAVKPSSYGSRDCLGKNLAPAEMRIIIAKLLWHMVYRTSSPIASEAWVEKPVLDLDMEERGGGGGTSIHVKLQSRVW